MAKVAWLFSPNRDTVLSLWLPSYVPGVHSAPPPPHPLNSGLVGLTGKAFTAQESPEAMNASDHSHLLIILKDLDVVPILSQSHQLKYVLLSTPA